MTLSSSITRYFKPSAQSLLLVQLVLITAIAAAAAPIEISSFDELCLIGADENYPLDGDYRLAADIDASGSRELDGGAGFAPIGSRRVVVQGGFGEPDVVDPDKAFTGTFDGGGHTVRGLYIRRAASGDAGANVGLFGFAYGARIRNVAVAADTVAGYRGVGALVGRQSGGVIENCAVFGVVSGEADVGGLAGVVEGGDTVRACYSAAAVGGGEVNDIGGLVGSAVGAVIAESYAVGGVGVAGGQRVGGLVGGLTGIAKVVSCYSMADVSGGGASSVGGLVGDNDGVVQRSYSAGAVSGAGGGVGGLIGSSGANGSAAFCFWDTDRSGLDASAGGSGSAGRTTAMMMDSSAAGVRNLVAGDGAAAWGISNNYPYLKNEFFPRYTLIITATRGGALSGVTTAGGTVHTQRANHWIAGGAVAAKPSPDSIVGGFDGWYLAGAADAALAAGRYDGAGFTVGMASAEGTSGEFSVSELTADSVAVEARFTLKKYRLKYIAGSGRGKVESLDADSGESAADTLVKIVEHGSVSSVRAVPNTGRLFLRWGIDRNDTIITTPSRTDTALGDASYIAYFTTDTVVLSYAAGPNGRLRVGNSSSGVQTHTAKPLYGADGPRIEAIPDLYYRFIGWSDGVMDNPRVDSAATENVSATALFSNTYEFTYIAGAGGKVAVREVGADGFTAPVDTAVVTVANSSPQTPAASAIAVADSGFAFVRWSDGVKDSVRNDASARSDSAVTAIFEVFVAVKSPDRVIPVGQAINEAALIQPVKAVSAGLTAGPNPALRQSGAVDFYWRGAAAVGGTLSVFDAVGNFVNTISIGINNNSGINNNGINKRHIAVWDLTDAAGKPVGAGTYLIKGTLSTKAGTREKVVLTVMLL